MFKEIKFEEIKENLGVTLAKKWTLITAGNQEKLNTMTISWGAFGELWYKNMVTVYIRQTRYTVEFLEKEEYFTISFYDDKYKKQLGICGSKSGRDIDKVKEISFTKKYDKAPYFEEANLVLICKKVAKTNMKNTEIYDKQIKEKEYNNEEYHYMYNGIIEKVLIRS